MRRIWPSRSSLLLLFLLANFLGPLGAGEAQASGKKRPAPVRPGVVVPENAHGSFELRVMTYNVKALPMPGLDHSRYADIGRELNRRRRAGTAPHVVAIQEAFYNRVEELVEEAGYPYLTAGPGPSFPQFGSGLIILSEYPFNWKVREVYSEATSFEINVRKGVHLGRLRIPGMPGGIEILNTHTQSDPEGDPTTPISETRRVRLSQIEQLARFYHREAERFLPSILMGDLNAAPRGGDRHYFTLMALLGLRNTTERCMERSTCYCGGAGGAGWVDSLDHILFRSAVGERIRIEPVSVEKSFDKPVNGRLLSDHPALEARYRVSW